MGPASRVPQQVPAPEDKSRSRKMREVVVEIPVRARKNIPVSTSVSDSALPSSLSPSSNVTTSNKKVTPRVHIKDLGMAESDEEPSDDEDEENPNASTVLAEKRLFDDVQSVIRPPIPSEHIQARSDIVPTKNITPTTAKEDLLKHKTTSRGVPIVADDPKSRTSPNTPGEKRVRFKGTDEDVATELCQSEVSLSIEEVAAISPSVRKILMRKLRNRKVSGKPAKSFFSDLSSTRRSAEPLEYKSLSEHTLVVDVEDIALEEVFEVLIEPRGNLPAGAVVQRDPVETYQQDVPAGERKDVVIVASNSDSLRVVFPKINGSDEDVENVKDCGSQIVVMSTLVAVGLAVSWDPTVTLHMQSANGQLKSTKGLARNVPFAFGDIEVYLQVHIVDDPPFQVLLGRPFDVLTSSVIENFPDGEQYITVTCPNTGKKCTIGTYPRGMGKKIRERKEPKLVPMEGNADKRTEAEHKKEDVAANFQTPSMK
jgi:hypothetical protein